MKSVKALGLTETLRKYVSDLRQNELAKAGDKRWMDCVYNSSGMFGIGQIWQWGSNYGQQMLLEYSLRQ